MVRRGRKQGTPHPRPNNIEPRLAGLSGRCGLSPIHFLREITSLVEVEVELHDAHDILVGKPVEVIVEPIAVDVVDLDLEEERH